MVGALAGCGMIAGVIAGATRRLGPPPGVSGDDCAHLSIRDQATPHGNLMWSRWDVTPRELAVLEQGGGVYFGIFGTAHPMITCAVGTHFEGDAPPPDRSPSDKCNAVSMQLVARLLTEFPDGPARMVALESVLMGGILTLGYDARQSIEFVDSISERVARRLIETDGAGT